MMEKALECYGVTHHLSTAYHPQTNGQVENANRGVKRILEKMVGKIQKDWSNKLNDALWAFRTAYMTPLGTTPLMIFHGKACHHPVELEHRALWALKTVNLDLIEVARKKFFQIHELEALRDAAYERLWSIKEKTKALHDKRIKGLKEFKTGDKVLLYNSRFKLFPGKLKSKWVGPHILKEVFPYGVIELYDEVDGGTWKVNG
ncbi:putative integrase, catalytic core, ribonuclease H-like superfamily [Helianthus annuus]|nr:putative integrase, catalytic core, ribonuclease H-like superfamily [Helianthus annuus]